MRKKYFKTNNENKSFFFKYLGSSFVRDEKKIHLAEGKHLQLASQRKAAIY